jgi:ATP-binding cassette subfamily B protein
MRPAPTQSKRSAASDLLLSKRLIKQAKPYWPHLFVLLIISLVSSPLALLGPLPLKIAVDSVVGNHPLPSAIDFWTPDWFTKSDYRLLILASTILVLVVIFNQLQGLGQHILSTKVGEGLKTSFRSSLFQHVQRLSLSFHDYRGTSDSIYRIQYDAPAIQTFMLNGVIPFISSFAILFSLIYVTAKIDWQLLLVALSISPILIVLSRLYRRRIRGRYHDLKELESRTLRIVQEVLTSLRIVKAFGREEEGQERFERQSNQGMLARIRLSSTEGAFGLVVNSVTAIGTASVLFVGILKVIRGDITLGDLLVIKAYLAQLYGPLRGATQKIATMQSSMVGAQRAFELLDEVPEVIERPNAMSLKRARGEIEFRNVSFHYRGKELAALHNVSFKIDPGIRLGIVGKTGAGKTTIASLLARFYDPASGEIFLDGVDLRDYKLADLRNQFGIVLQEPVLFSTTIAENIAYGRPKATFDDIVAAAKAANAHDFILTQRDGYNTVLGERGMTLSGGQRQIISLARAFLRDAPIMILDEPTSSVDLHSEALILEAMERLMKDRTSLLIAHRPTALKDRDLYLFLEEGNLVSLSSEPPTFLMQRSYGS